MNDDHSDRWELSEQGRARRDAMLAELTPRVQRAARARRIRSGVAACVALLVLASVVVLTPNTPTPRLPEQISVDPGTAHPSPETDSSSGILMVSTDPGILDRLTWRGTSGASRIERINDDELLLVLAEMGRPAGLIRSRGRVWLTAAVTDAELKPDALNRNNSG